jgi:quercetin dioxygenase-like cupin family protein
MKIVKMTEGEPFDMGLGDTRRVIGPHTGAKHLTFNYARFGPGQAFKQHIHPHSEDLILVLEGGGVIRLDDQEFPIEPGDVIHVAEGEYHGTVAGPEGLLCVSVQAPIDPALYQGGTQPEDEPC